MNASSLSWTKDTAADGTAIEYSQGEYQSLLEQEGREALAQAQRVQAVKSAVDPRSNQRYRMDWDLGDKVTYVDVYKRQLCRRVSFRSSRQASPNR